MANWITLPSVSTTYSSVTVSVTGGIDLSSVLAGWALIINGVPVEIASGTAADADGNSALTLATPWDGASIANQPAKIQPTGAPFLAGIAALEETNSYAIDVHNALAEIATLDKDVTIKDPTGEEHTFATMPKIAREAAEQRAGLAKDYASTKTVLSDDYETKKAELTEIVNFKPPCPATLDCDFARNIYRVIDDYATGFVETSDYTQILSFTRASSANLTNASGGQTTVGTDVLRRTFDPETGEALGAQIEERRTNLLTNSEFPNGLSDAPFSTGDISLSTMDIGKGATSAIFYGADVTLLAYALKNNYATINGKTYTISVFVEMEDGLPPSFSSAERDSPLNDFAFALGAGSNSPLLYSISHEIGNVYRVSLTKTEASAGTNHGVIRYSTNSGRAFKVTGYQLMIGAFPASYMKTEDLTATREPDNLWRTLGSEFNSSEFTVYIEFSLYDVEQGFQGIISDGTNKAVLYLSSKELRAHDGQNVTVFAANMKPKTMVVAAVSVTKTNVYGAVNGSNAVTGGNNGSLNNINTIALFQHLTNKANGTIKRFALFPRAFEAATLKQLTTQGLD